MKFYRYFILILLASGLAACEQSNDTTTAAGAEKSEPVSSKPLSLEIQYSIEEPDLEPYISRVIMTDDFMRIDEGEGSTSFVLFDRKKKVVYSVASDNDAILIVNERKIPDESPVPITDSVREVKDDNIPTIDNKKAVQYFFDTNGVNCYQAFIVAGFLPRAVETYKEYRRILAGDHAFTMSNVPADVLEPCDLSMNVFSSTRLFDKGLPIHERGPHGFVKTLLSYNEEYKPAAALFELPKDYGRFTIDDMRQMLTPPASEPGVDSLLQEVIPDTAPAQ